MKKLAVTLLFCMFLPFALIAQQHNDSSPLEPEHNYNHHAGLFLGAATNLDAEHTDIAIGADWEYFLHGTSPNLGVGLMAEVVLAEHTEYIAAVPVFLHPWSALKFWVAPGVIYAQPHASHDSHDDGHKFNLRDRPQKGDEGTSEAWTNFLIRFGAGYDFHVGHMSITPTFAVDVFKSQAALVYGVTFGMAF